ncbi:MAG: SDR family NAD(P)-dependent oxidoreductase [Vallitaleaceae bacterium]|nr:SDR family NAD(P)-dependent oxidoreductase [Vallitaleaceae bacterium]
MNYKGEVVVVTGAGEGIGRAIALHYAKEGAKVVVADFNEKTGRETVDLIYDQNGQGIFLEVDVTKERDVVLLMENVIYCYGKIDILINNVGVHYSKPLLELNCVEWDHIINVNLRSVFLCTKEAVKYMKVMRKGAIINIASSKSFLTEPNSEAYVAAKGGIISMTKSLSASLKEYNIQVNCISPGFVKTKGYERLSEVVCISQSHSFLVSDADSIAMACLSITMEDNDYVNGTNVIMDDSLIRKMVYYDK